MSVSLERKWLNKKKWYSIFRDLWKMFNFVQVQGRRKF